MGKAGAIGKTKTAKNPQPINIFPQTPVYPRFGGPQRVEHGETRAAQNSAALRAARAKAWEPCGIALRRGKRLGPSMVLAPPFSTKRWRKEDGIAGMKNGLLVSLRASLPQRPTRGIGNTIVHFYLTPADRGQLPLSSRAGEGWIR
jgi:hypothetical protein